MIAAQREITLVRLDAGGIAQLLAGMWEARRGKIFGATAFSSYGAFWISFGLFGILSTVSCHHSSSHGVAPPLAAQHGRAGS